MTTSASFAPRVDVSPRRALESQPGARRDEHRYDIDLLRLLCSCAVILCHVGAEFLAAVDRDAGNGAPVYWAGMSADALSRFAVPMYFAIAGWAVLVGAPPKDGAQLWRRLVRILVPMGVWTALYLAWAKLRGTHEAPVFSLAVDSLFSSIQPAYHLWYLYSYVPVIVLLACASMVRAGRRPWLLGVLLLGFALAPVALADLGRLTGWVSPRFAWGFGIYQVVYAVAGALLLALPASGGRRRRLLWLGAAGAGALAVFWYQHAVSYVIPNASVIVALFTGAVLLGLSRLRIPGQLRPMTVRLAGAALGAYLVHVLIIDIAATPLVSAGLGWAQAGLLAAGLTAASIVLSFGAALLWQRLGLKKWLG